MTFSNTVNYWKKEIIVVAIFIGVVVIFGAISVLLNGGVK